MNSYSPVLPRDKNNEVKQNYIPAKLSLASTNIENASASSILLLGHNITELEVAAVNQHIALKWMTQTLIDSSGAGTSVLTAAGSENWHAAFVFGVADYGHDFGGKDGIERMPTDLANDVVGRFDALLT